MDRPAVMLHDGPAPARVHPWPGEPGVAHLVVLDSTAVPMAAHFDAWRRRLAELGYQRFRTGALAPRAATQAESSGMHCIQELALLEARAPFTRRSARRRVRRPDTREFVHLAEIDRAAFGPGWHLDDAMLLDVLSATPHSRVRAVRSVDVTGRTDRRTNRSWVGFVISGRSGPSGYVQRLAVHPDVHRRGAASRLLGDALTWFERTHCDRALVNTDVANEPALGLYRSHGFADLPDRLRVYEGSTC